MIRVILGGRLGNVLFEYAAARHLALRNKVPLQVNLVNHLALRDPAAHRLTKNLAYFNLQATFSCPWAMKLCTYINRRCERWYSGYYREKELIGFDPTVLQLGPDTVLSGLFQSYHYFTEIEPLIRKELVLSGLPETTAYSLLKEEIVSSCSVAVHVRRGDYLHAPFLEVCTTDYYEKAIRHFLEQFERPKFFIFSDDLAWCHDHLHVPNAVFVDIPEARDLPVIDLDLMKNCRHLIVANSTFSWWGAWLNSYEQKQVVTPQYWFKETMTGMNQQAQKHLIPEAWIRI